ARAHAALGAAGVIRGMRVMTARARFFGADDLVVKLAAETPRAPESNADLDSLHRLNRHHLPGNPRIELAVPLHMRTEARRQAPRARLDHATQAVLALLGIRDDRTHFLCRFGIAATHIAGHGKGMNLLTRD